MMQPIYSTMIHQIQKKSKTIKIILMLSIILITLVQNAICTRADVEKDIDGNIYRKLPIHSIIEHSEHIKKENYKKDEKSFTLIRDISICKYTSRSSDIFVVERNVLPYLPNNCFLTCSYSEVAQDGLVKKRCAMQEGTPSQTEKKMLIIPYSMVKMQYHLGRLNYVRETYLKPTKLFEKTKMAVAYLKSIFIQMLCSKYIECMHSAHEEKDRMKTFIDFLKKNDMIERRYLEVIGLKNTFFYELVGIIEDFHLEEDIYRLHSHVTARKERIGSAFEKNQTLRKMADKGLSEIEKEYQKGSKAVYSMVNNTTMHSCSDLATLIEAIKEETVECIAALVNGSAKYYRLILTEKIEEELGQIEGFPKEKEIITKVVSSIRSRLSRYICSTEAARTIEEVIEETAEEVIDKWFKKEANELNIAFIKEIVNSFVEINEGLLLKETFEWDKTLICLLTSRIKYSLSNKKIDKIKKGLDTLDKEIISEVDGKRRQKYKEFRKISALQDIYNEKIKVIEDRIYEQYKRVIYGKEKIEIVDDSTESEIISLLSHVTVHYSKPLKAEKSRKLDLRKKFEQIFYKKNYNEKEVEEKNIRNILRNIKKEFLSFRHIDETEKVYQIKENRKKIFNLEFGEQISATEDGNILAMIEYVREVLVFFAKLLVDKRISYSNPSAIGQAEAMLAEESQNIEGMTIEDIKNMFKFLLCFQDGSLSCIDMYPALWDIKEANGRSFYFICNDEMRLCLAEEAGNLADWIRRTDLCDIYTVLQPLYTMASNFTRICSYSEVWENPVFLSIYSVYNKHTQKCERKGHITYRLEEYSEFYEKKIELSDANLAAFKNARTAEDINKIEGETVKKPVIFKRVCC